MQVKITTTGNPESVLIKLESKIRDKSVLLQKIGEYQQRVIKDCFLKQSNPKGELWKKNTALTKQHKKGFRGRLPAIKGENHVGVWTGTLSSQIKFNVVGDSVYIGVMEYPANVYAKTFQYGASEGAFGRGMFNNPIPWGDIPPRQFVGLSNHSTEDIKKILKRYLSV